MKCIKKLVALTLAAVLALTMLTACGGTPVSYTHLTLLKTIAGVYKPSKGKVTVNGTIAPLIELGAGFDMDLTLSLIHIFMGLTGAVALLAAAFFVVGIAKGSVINTCTILVSDHSADRTRGRCV